MLADALSSNDPRDAITKDLAETPVVPQTYLSQHVDLTAGGADYESMEAQVKAQISQVSGTYIGTFSKIIETFRSYLNDVAEQNHDSVISTYTNADDLLSIPQKTFYLSLKLNSAWNFGFTAVEFKEYAVLTIYTTAYPNNVSFQIISADKTLRSTFIEGSRSFPQVVVPLDKDENEIKRELNMLIYATKIRNPLNQSLSAPDKSISPH